MQYLACDYRSVRAGSGVRERRQRRAGATASGRPGSPFRLLSPRSLRRPETPLAQDTLFVHAPHEPNLGAELVAELESADAVDLISAFIVWTRLRIFLDVLAKLRARRVRVRVLTTTYTGITDPHALDTLRDLGVEVKVSYDTGITRLHAKAWLIRRESGFSTAYVGSSNMTHTALTTVSSGMCDSQKRARLNW